MKFSRYVFRTVNYLNKHHLNSPRVKGFIGENLVNSVLLNEPYKLHNVIITGNKKAQIDHILISNKGIIVIETKNYQGLINGKVNEKYWIQYLNKKQYVFLNPIRQNNYHLNVLVERYPNYKKFFHSVIVFTRNAQVIIDDKTKTIYVDELAKYLENLPDTGLPQAEQKELFDSLSAFKQE